MACNFIVRRRQTSRFTLSLIGCTLLISVVFLIATLATGFLLPTNHHVLHWRCQTYYVACLIIGDILLAIVQLSGNAIKVKSTECVSIGKLNELIRWREAIQIQRIRVICIWYWAFCCWTNMCVKWNCVTEKVERRFEKCQNKVDLVCQIVNETKQLILCKAYTFSYETSLICTCQPFLTYFIGRIKTIT